MVDPELHPDLPGELMPVVLYTVVTRQGTVLLWPARLPGESGRGNSWHQSLLQYPARREVSCGLRSEGTPLLRLGLTKQALSHPQ